MKRGSWVVGIAAAVIAVGTLLVVRRDAAAPAVESTLQLPITRAVETRFTGEHYARHRPYHAAKLEPVSLATLAALERRNARGDLVAALASSGDLSRARQVLGGATDAATDADRAAIALLEGDAERALDASYRALRRDPALAAASWNLALAARARGLLRVSRAAFERVVARGEPGWVEEARAQIAALTAALAPRDELAAFDARGRAMVDGGPAISVDEVRRFPAFARVYLLDALRLASGPALDALRPQAKALDELSGRPVMIAALERAAAAPTALRAKFAPAYRKLIARAASPAEIDQLIDALGKAGPGVDDLRAGAIITGGRAATRLPELMQVVAPWGDPWFDLAVVRAKIQHDFPPGDQRAEPALASVLDGLVAHDPGDAFALRVGQLAQDLAQLRADSGREQDAERWAQHAVDDFARTVAAVHLETARADLGSLHRTLGRTALARAELEEVVLAVGDASCHLKRFASIALADLALGAQDWDRVREILPPPVPPEGCQEALVFQGIATSTDLARQTGDARDLAAARQWITDARNARQPDRDGVALVATARLARGTDAAAMTAVHDWLAQHPPTADPERIVTRTWGFTTLVTDAAARLDWSGVLSVAAFEHPATAAAPCAVVVDLDDGVLTVAARTPAGARGEQRRIDPAQLATTTLIPSTLSDALSSCASIAVDARPPLHGRADILPASLPWWFAGDAAGATSPRRGSAVIVTNPRPPDPSLPVLPPAEPSSASFATRIEGATATPTRVLAALTDAGYAELHVHGVAAAHNEDAAFLALSSDPDGTYTLSAERVRRAKLHNAPLIVLAACRAASVAAYLRQRWSLPDAFLAGGAGAVVAVDIPIPDRSAQAVFDELHQALDAGAPVETAVARLRARATGDTAWARHLMVFR